MIALVLSRPRGGDGHHHNCLVVYKRRWRDWLRVTHWVVCIRCGTLFGPHRERWRAWAQAYELNGEAEPEWIRAQRRNGTGHDGPVNT